MTYSSSLATKMKLIMAAGELYAEQGIQHITVRAIARRSGENMGSIKYHFGDKDGLLAAVLDFATERLQHDPLGVCLAQNRSLLQTKIGQCRLIAGLVELFMKIIFDHEKPTWCLKLVSQVLQGNLPVSQQLFDHCATPIIRVFTTVHQAITGECNPAAAFAWMTITISPMYTLSIDNSITRHIYYNQPIPPAAMTALKNMAIRGALVNLGLWDHQLESELP
ncbi:MAG: TetR/AcrR family transcriptional regulator [Victivallales bacterium]|nr:TetR/AcrR family transcriptional regulator [Victivallales bacterium]